MRVCKTFYFDAAHRLPSYEGKCKNLHGHRWELQCELEGTADPRTGFVVDFVHLKQVVTGRVIDNLDHCYLNEILLNPTCENLLCQIYVWLNPVLNISTSRISRLRLYETPDSYAEEVF